MICIILGTAFHCYGGNYQAPGILSQEFPSKSIFFTECTGHGEDDEEGLITYLMLQRILQICFKILEILI